MQNVVIGNGVKLAIADKQRPFSNNFVQHSVIEQVEPNEVQAYVKCTNDSKEPGRIYFVAYCKFTGLLMECYTIN